MAEPIALPKSKSVVTPLVIAFTKVAVMAPPVMFKSSFSDKTTRDI